MKRGISALFSERVAFRFSYSKATRFSIRESGRSFRFHFDLDLGPVRMMAAASVANM